MFWRIKNGDGREDDIEKMVQLGELIISHSICGLGQAAPLPIRNMMKIEEFKKELLEHIRMGFCRAKVCSMEHSPQKKLGFGLGVEAEHDYRPASESVAELPTSV
jgi:hypothetical protein